MQSSKNTNNTTRICSLGSWDLVHPEGNILRDERGKIVGLCGSSGSTGRRADDISVSSSLFPRSGQEWSRILTPATGIRILDIDGWRQNIPPMVHQGVKTPPIQINVGSRAFEAAQPLDDSGTFYRDVPISLYEFAYRTYDCTLERKRLASSPSESQSSYANTRAAFVDHVVAAIHKYMQSL